MTKRYNSGMSLSDLFTANRRITIWVCAFIIILTVLVSVFRNHCVSKFILGYFSDWSIALSAGAAVILLYVVYMSHLQTRRMREEDRETDSKKHQLDGILKWAQEVRRELLLPRSYDLGFYKLRLAMGNVAVGDEWAIMTAATFGEDFQKTVRQTTKNLRDYILALSQGEESKARMDALTESLTKVLEAAYEIKTRQKL